MLHTYQPSLFAPFAGRVASASAVAIDAASDAKSIVRTHW